MAVIARSSRGQVDLYQAVSQKEEGLQLFRECYQAPQLGASFSQKMFVRKGPAFPGFRPEEMNSPPPASWNQGSSPPQSSNNGSRFDSEAQTTLAGSSVATSTTSGSDSSRREEKYVPDSGSGRFMGLLTGKYPLDGPMPGCPPMTVTTEAYGQYTFPQCYQPLFPSVVPATVRVLPSSGDQSPSNNNGRSAMDTPSTSPLQSPASGSNSSTEVQVTTMPDVVHSCTPTTTTRGRGRPKSVHVGRIVGGGSGVPKFRVNDELSKKEKPFVCPACSKCFRQKSTLLQHERIHLNSRPYRCPDCGKEFRQQTHLTQHLRIHANEKPYECEHCGRCFRQRTILNQHLRIHSGEKPYKCMHCGKNFRQKAILDQHVRTHQGDRPYCCPAPKCRKRFTQQADLNHHLKMHQEHPDGPQPRRGRPSKSKAAAAAAAAAAGPPTLTPMSSPTFVHPPTLHYLAGPYATQGHPIYPGQSPMSPPPQQPPPIHSPAPIHSPSPGLASSSPHAHHPPNAAAEETVTTSRYMPRPDSAPSV